MEVPNQVLFRIECIAATSNGHPQYNKSSTTLSRENQRPESSDLEFEEHAQKAARDAGYKIFTHYSRDEVNLNPLPLVFYALRTSNDPKPQDLRVAFDEMFGIPTESCIAIEHLIFHMGEMMIG